MFSNNYYIFPALLYSVDQNMNILPFYVGNILLYPNQTNSLNGDYSINSTLPNMAKNPVITQNENNGYNSSNNEIKNEPNNSCEFSMGQDKKNYFKVVHSQKDSLFNKTDNNNFVLEKEGENFLGRKRFSNRRKRKDNKDNIRKKIKRGFLNNALINKLNDLLRNMKSNKYFRKFPQSFVKDINQKRNKEIVDMTLGQIFEKEELYTNEGKSGFENYLHNLKVVQSDEIKENEEFTKILNKKFCELYEEYINSEEFKIGEMERLKKHKMQDEYIKRYIHLSKNLINFFQQ